MATFILTWNPDAWTDGDDWIADNAGVATASEPVAGAYSTGVRRQGIVAGDRAMLLRQRRDRGIVASGYFTTEIYDDEHWDGTGRVPRITRTLSSTASPPSTIAFRSTS